MKSEIIGYVVVSRTGEIYCAGIKGTHEEGVLWFGVDATLFPTRAIARKFIRQSKKYVTENGYTWPWLDDSYVMPVRKLA